MSPAVFEAFESIINLHFRRGEIKNALEVGAGAWTLLSIPVLKNARRVALNLRFDKSSPELAETEMIIGNANQLEFPDGSFDCVLSSSALEHDRYFWRSIAEIKRVLRPNGLFVVGVPIYMTLPTDKDYTTVTYARHGIAYNADFYRFSEQAVREVFFEGYSSVVEQRLVRTLPNPYLVAAGRK